jgi:hypothetical protein
MESLLREVPEDLLHRPHQSLTEQEAQDQLDSVLALIEQVLATDNQHGESSEQFDLDPRPGHILLRNNAPGQHVYDNLEEAEANFHGTREEGFLECKFRRFSAQGSLIRAETLKAQSTSTHVELLRRVWKLDFGDRITFFHIDLNHLELSYSQSINE